MENIIKEYDNKNVIFFKYRERIYPFKIAIMKTYFQNLKDKKKANFQEFIFKTLFPTPRTTYLYLIDKSRSFIQQRYPIVISKKLSVVLGNVDIYLSPELYAKNKSFKNNLKKREK